MVITTWPSSWSCIVPLHLLKPEEGVPQHKVEHTLRYISTIQKNKYPKIIKKRETGLISSSRNITKVLKNYLTEDEINLISYAYRVYDIKFRLAEAKRETRGIKGFVVNKSANINFQDIYNKFYEYIPKLAEYYIKPPSEAPFKYYKNPVVNVERFSVGINKPYAVFRVNTRFGYKYYGILHSDYYENYKRPNEIHHPDKILFIFRTYDTYYDKVSTDIEHCLNHEIKSRNKSRASRSVTPRVSSSSPPRPSQASQASQL